VKKLAKIQKNFRIENISDDLIYNVMLISNNFRRQGREHREPVCESRRPGHGLSDGRRNQADAGARLRPGAQRPGHPRPQLRQADGAAEPRRRRRGRPCDPGRRQNRGGHQRRRHQRKPRGGQQRRRPGAVQHGAGDAQGGAGQGAQQGGQGTGSVRRPPHRGSRQRHRAPRGQTRSARLGPPVHGRSPSQLHPRPRCPLHQGEIIFFVTW